jgi:hypothetical protein
MSSTRRPQLFDRATRVMRPARVRCAACQQIATVGTVHGDPAHEVTPREEATACD